MVCAKCEKKLEKEKLACTDVWKPAKGSTLEKRNDRAIGENKLLSSKARYSPYAPGGSKATSSATARGKGTGVTFTKCTVCMNNVGRTGAKYCQACAYKRGVCAMCAKPILDTSQYKMSSK